MVLAELLDNLTLAGITVTVQDGKLKATAPRGESLERWREEIRQHKAELIKHLESGAGPDIISSIGKNTDADPREDGEEYSLESHIREVMKDMPEAYRQDIRELWAYGLKRYSRAFQKYDGMTDTEATAVAREVMQLNCIDGIRAGKMHGAPSIRQALIEVIENQTPQSTEEEQDGTGGTAGK